MKKLSASVTAALLRNLSFLIGVGMTPLEAAQNLSQQNNSRGKKQDKKAEQMEKSAKCLIPELENGLTISEAFKVHEDVFGALYRQIEAGERSGNMTEAIKRIANQLTEGTKTKGKVRSAMAYPVFLLVMVFAASIFLFGKILPTTFAAMQDDVGMTLPPLTKAVFNVVSFLQQRGLLLMLILALVVGGIVYLARGPLKEPAHRIYSHLSVIGRLVRDNSVVAYYNSLNYMLFAGVALDEAMTVAANSVSNLFIRHQLLDAASLYSRTGVPLNEALADVDAITDMELASITVGYRSDHLKDVLVELEGKRKETLEQSLAKVVSLAQPVAIIFIGLLVGIVALALYPPMFSSGSTTSNLTTF